MTVEEALEILRDVVGCCGSELNEFSNLPYAAQRALSVVINALHPPKAPQLPVTMEMAAKLEAVDLWFVAEIARRLANFDRPRWWHRVSPKSK